RHEEQRQDRRDREEAEAGRERPRAANVEAPAGSRSRNGDGGAQNLIILCVDITERKLAQSVLAESEERLRLQFKATPVPIFSWQKTDDDFVLIDYNDAADQMTQHDIRKLLGCRASDLYVDTPEVTEYMRACFTNRTMIRKSGDFRLLSTGQPKHFDVRFLFVPPDLVMIHTEDITARKNTEEILRASEHRFATAFHSNAIAMVITRLDDETILEVNQQFLELFGYFREEVIGQTTLELQLWPPPEIRAVVVDQLRSGLSVRNVESEIKNRSGEVHNVLFSSSTITLGNETCGLGMIVDITEQKRSQEAQREAERKYRNIFENANEGIFQTTPEGHFLTANPALARMLGFASPEELIRERTDIAAQHYVNRARHQQFKRLMEHHGAVRGFEYEANRSDGSTIWISASVRTVRDNNGKNVYYEGIAEDITERKSSERELRKQKEILQKIFDHIPVMINFIERDGRILLVNQEWERTLGWTLNEVVAKNLDILAECYPDFADRSEVIDFISNCESGWKEFTTRVRDGRLIDTSWAIVKLSDNTIIGFGKEITQQKRAEKLTNAAALLSHGLSGARTHLDAAVIITDVTHKLFGWDSFSFELYEADTDQVRTILEMDTIGGERKNITPFTAQRPPSEKVRRVMQKGAELTIRESPYLLEATVVPFPDLSRPSANIMTVPIRYGQKIVGFLSIQSYDPHAYDERSLQDLQSLADLCGEALNRIRAEQSLYEAEERFRQIAENIDEVIWIFDSDAKNLLYINPAYEKVWGRPADPLYRQIRSCIAAVHPDDREKTDAAIRSQIQGNYHSFEFRITRPDGSIRWVRQRPFPIYDASGKLYRIASVSDDITERKRAETELRNYSRGLIKAQEAERKHIARELHDDIGQVLTAVRINLQNKQLRNPEFMAAQLDESINVIDDALARVRDLSFELRPSLLDDLGLAAATRWYVKTFADRAGLKVELRIDPEVVTIRLPKEVETACFRILQEGVSNVARHAQATKTMIKLQRCDGQLLLSISDNGIGIALPSLQSGDSRLTIGLRGMEERALAVGGCLKIISTLAEGTQIQAAFPLPVSNEHEFARSPRGISSH
ncbi:MAG: PAS domain S-box protein, partial [Pyrinomonadaceae bacterium]